MRRPALMLVLSAVVGAVVAAPVAVYAAHGFIDVPSSNTFHADIEWLKDAGVTFGCNPPANTQFCPDDFVTRAQMSAFMRRLAENQVVDAATAQSAETAKTATSAETAATAQTAQNANRLGGRTRAQLTPRAAFNSTNDAANGTPLTLSAEVTAPARGVLLMSGGVEMFSVSTQVFPVCQLEINDSLVSGSRRISSVGGSTGANSEEDCTTSGAAVVDSGTHRIDFAVQGVVTTTALGPASVWVLWVPLDGSGAIPTAITELGDATDFAEELTNR